MGQQQTQLQILVHEKIKIKKLGACQFLCIIYLCIDNYIILYCTRDEVGVQLQTVINVLV